MHGAYDRKVFVTGNFWALFCVLPCLFDIEKIRDLQMSVCATPVTSLVPCEYRWRYRYCLADLKEGQAKDTRQEHVP